MMLYGLLIHPFLFPPLPLHKSTMEDLEMHRRTAERSEAQVPCPQEDIEHSASEGGSIALVALVALVAPGIGVAAPFALERADGTSVTRERSGKQHIGILPVCRGHGGQRCRSHRGREMSSSKNVSVTQVDIKFDGTHPWRICSSRPVADSRPLIGRH